MIGEYVAPGFASVTFPCSAHKVVGLSDQAMGKTTTKCM